MLPFLFLLMVGHIALTLVQKKTCALWRCGVVSSVRLFVFFFLLRQLLFVTLFESVNSQEFWCSTMKMKEADLEKVRIDQ